MNKKKIIIYIIIILVCFFSYQLYMATRTIKIGLAGTLSGPASELGVSGRNGFNLAVGIINESGGINGRLIEPVIKDDKGDLNRAKN